MQPSDGTLGALACIQGVSCWTSPFSIGNMTVNIPCRNWIGITISGCLWLKLIIYIYNSNTSEGCLASSASSQKPLKSTLFAASACKPRPASHKFNGEPGCRRHPMTPTYQKLRWWWTTWLPISNVHAHLSSKFIRHRASKLWRPIRMQMAPTVTTNACQGHL